ncbi:MAG: hypothetical protein AAFY72_06145 [Cyanobacteria bacterium J06649_4]
MKDIARPITVSTIIAVASLAGAPSRVVENVTNSWKGNEYSIEGVKKSDLFKHYEAEDKRKREKRKKDLEADTNARNQPEISG